MPDYPVPRRTVLVGAGASAGILALAACTPASQQGSGPQPLATLADIPVGGAVAATDAKGLPILVAQPSAGRAVAFSAICTHRGCTVAPAGRELRCPCHGSVYDAGTGAVIHGPAPRGLTPVPVQVRDGAVLAVGA